MRHAIVLTIVAALTGCAVTPSTTTQSPSARQSSGSFTVEHFQLSFDDPDAVFAPAFKEYRWFSKEKLETESEYRQRLEATGVSGREVTFLIRPELCDVFAFPDKGFYVIVSKDGFSPTVSRYETFDQKEGAITVSETTHSKGTTTMQNAFGVSAEVSRYEGKRRMLRLEGFDHFPMSLRWKENANSYSIHFGLPVRTVDPGFRALLKDKKVGLAVRGKIGDIAKSGQTADILIPKIDSPISSHDEVTILPFAIEEASVVDTTSMTSIVRWTRQ